VALTRDGVETVARRDVQQRRPSIRSGIAWGVGGSAVALAVILVAHAFRRGAVAARIRNPAVHGAPRPVHPLGLGGNGNITALQIGTVVALAALATVFTVGWRRNPRSPVLLMAFACTALVWLDPVMNWAPYAVYNPQLWHFPETWAWVSLSPTVEPFIVIGYVMFYLGPYFPAMYLLRRIQRSRPPTSFVWRHPLIVLAALIVPIGFVFDGLLETFLVRQGLYIYAQTIRFGSVFAGHTYQFPLIWESTFVTLVMVPAGVLLYRDDTGRTVAERLGQRLRFGARRPALTSFLVMFAVLNVAYLCYGGAFAAIRASGAATSVACPWPYPEAKVYDPQGDYQAAGQAGPFFSGIMSGWPTGQSGRPAVTSPLGGGRCS
jgi:hypothetical protein